MSPSDMTDEQLRAEFDDPIRQAQVERMFAEGKDITRLNNRYTALVVEMGRRGLIPDEDF